MKTGAGVGGGTSFNGLYGKALPKGVPFSGFMYRVGISQVEVCKR